MLKMPKLPKLNKYNLDRISKHSEYDQIIFVGIIGEDITLVSSCETREETTAILEVASLNCRSNLFPDMANDWVH